ncbi:MAG: sodium:solute symporter [Bacteroidetes bacterium]|jgi:SSS family solute:Na+ symporter|nr:sodium:solute symporter [Bacteroidota bacterium]MDF1864283.1 sodium:solute symporter [Saprospiraceae bacterium]
MHSIELSTLDIVIMILYGVLIIGYGLYHAKRESSEEYFLAGRNMLWPIVGISLFAANISSSTLVGLAGDAFKTNTHVYNYEWLAAVVLVFFAVFFLPFYLKSRVYTMPEFLERRYDVRSRYYFSFITIVGNVLLDTAAGLYVGTIILKLMFPEMTTTMIVVILALAAAAYTVPGGLNSVIQTEVVQAVLLVFGSMLLTYYAFSHEAVGGWAGFIEGLDAMGAKGELVSELSDGTTRALSGASETLSLVRPSDDAFMPWTGLLLGAPILGFYFWANNQFMVQRVLGAKDMNHGRWGALFAGFLKLPVIFFMVLPGTAAILIYSDLDLTFMNYQLANGEICQNLGDCPNATYPLLLFDLLPTGVLGLVLAGLLAAMMSSVSATFNSASTLVTMDFVQKLRPGMSSQQLVRAGQITTLILVILASAWAPMIERFDSLWEYLQSVLSYIAPPVAATFVVGLFWRRANGSGSIAALLTGFIAAVIMVAASVLVSQAESAGTEAPGWASYVGGIHFLHFTFILFVVCIIINMVVSLMTAAPEESFQRTASIDDVERLGGNVKPGDLISDQLENYVWKKSLFTEETEELQSLPWYMNYRYQAVALLAVTAILVGYFW